MSPIERVRARAAALEALGLRYYATDQEVREAWHRIALECHPDRSETQMERFTRAKLARDFLLGSDNGERRIEADPAPAPRTEPRPEPRTESADKVAPRRVKRPGPARRRMVARPVT